MYCKNCKNQLSKEDKFCKNCGAAVENVNNNQQVNQTQNQQKLNSNETNNISNKKKKNPLIIISVIVVMLIIFLGILFIIKMLYSGNNKKNDDYYNETNKDNYNNNNNYYDNYENKDINSNYNNSNNNDIDINNNKNKVEGNYTREIFSGNSFDYKTIADGAVFSFNPNSTFTVVYNEGSTYSGTYEVYNGLYITLKADEIANDNTIQNAEILANDIKNASTAMMTNTTELLNTYLLWLKTNDDILQPFLIKYDSDTNTGTALNIFASQQGSFKLK